MKKIFTLIAAAFMAVGANAQKYYFAESDIQAKDEVNKPLNGKTYGLKCEVVEARPIVCKKCGASFQMKYGEGRCDHCGTYYTTHFYIEEKDI